MNHGAELKVGVTVDRVAGAFRGSRCLGSVLGKAFAAHKGVNVLAIHA